MDFERWFEAFPPGFHSYQPFRNVGSQPSLGTLQDRCKLCILQRVPLDRVRERSLGLPRPLIRYLRRFSTDDFVEVECAPLVDIFDFDFYHRAMTYKVRSKWDRREYVATHGFTLAHDDDPQQARDRDRWMEDTDHDHLMPIYGTVTDTRTGNVFYLLRVPQVSLDHVQKMLFNSKITVPEIELWKLAYHLSSALLHIQSLGLSYGAFGLDNIFLVDNKVVLENELTRKSRMYLLSRVDLNLWKRIPREPWHEAQSTMLRDQSDPASTVHTDETQTLWYLGYILDKLAGVQQDDVEPLIFHFEVPDNHTFYTKKLNLRSGVCYSDELCQLIVNAQVNISNKLSLFQVQRTARKMIDKLQNERNDDKKLRNGLLELAKEEFEIRKQTRWR